MRHKVTVRMPFVQHSIQFKPIQACSRSRQTVSFWASSSDNNDNNKHHNAITCAGQSRFFQAAVDAVPGHAEATWSRSRCRSDQCLHRRTVPSALVPPSMGSNELYDRYEACTCRFPEVVWMAFAVMATQTHHCGIRWPWIDFFSMQVRKFATKKAAGCFDVFSTCADLDFEVREAEAQPNFHDFHHVPRLHFLERTGSVGPRLRRVLHDVTKFGVHDGLRRMS